MTLEKPKTVADVLEAAADLIEPEGAWCQRHYSCGEARCLVGAISTVGQRALTTVAALERLGFTQLSHATHWNDQPGRTQGEVVAALRSAASLSRQNEEKPMGEAWKRYAADFNALSDEEAESERATAQALVDEQEDWLEAVASWEAAGKPRNVA